MDISIIIPTYKRPKQLEDLLNSIKLQKTKILYETIVVSNTYEKKVKSLCQKYQKVMNISYHFAGKRGVNIARNLGIRRARGSTFLFIDDDCFLCTNSFLQNVYQSHVNFSETDVIGGSYIIDFKKSSYLEKAYQKLYENWINNWTENSPPPLVGGNLSAKSYLFKDRIKFSEEIKFGSSETELVYRLYLENKKILFLKDLTIQHNAKINLVSFAKKAYLQGYNAPELLASKSVCNADQRLVKIYIKFYNYFFHLGYLKKSEKIRLEQHADFLFLRIIKDLSMSTYEQVMETFICIILKLSNKSFIKALMKIYYILEYQLSKNKQFRKLFNKYNDDDYSNSIK